MTDVAADAAAWTSCTLRLKVKVDGSNYRVMDTIALNKGYLALKPAIMIEVPAVTQHVQITMQLDVALATDQDIPYSFVKESLE
jgi:hypothetical protein